MESMLLYFSEYREQALRLASSLGLESSEVHVHGFPDGESLVRLPVDLPRRVLVCRSLFRPNSKLVELMLAARVARQAGVERIGLVAPYLCYMRQDRAFHPGEAVSQQIIGQFLASLFDCIVTVDAHLHRVHSIEDVFPGIESANLSAAGPVAEYLSAIPGSRPLLLGPDEESGQWVSQVARMCSLDYAVCTKERRGDRDVEVSLPPIGSSVDRVVIVDDILSTGKTVAVVAGLLKEKGIAMVECLVTHAVFAPGARELLEENGVEQVVSTDSIPHDTNRIQLAPVIAGYLKEHSC